MVVKRLLRPRTLTLCLKVSCNFARYLNIKIKPEVNIKNIKQYNLMRIPLTQDSSVVQWLRLHAPNAVGRGSIPGQGTRSHMLPLRARVLQLRPGAAK